LRVLERTPRRINNEGSHRILAWVTRRVSISPIISLLQAIIGKLRQPPTAGNIVFGVEACKKANARGLKHGSRTILRLNMDLGLREKGKSRVRQEEPPAQIQRGYESTVC